jgi:ABC-type taurine transport system substrate-binding protein
MATSGARKKFKLNLAKLRGALAKAQKEADLALKAGPQAIAAAKKRGDLTAARMHGKTLANAKRSKKNLAKSIQLIKNSCCDQFLNCDPDFS